jgi:xanthine dehydrogenase accessory factor
VHWSSTLKLKLAQKPAIWVTVLQAQGSVPRGAGTVMAVFADDFLGTIGGGHLEFEALAQARQYLMDPAHLPALPFEKRIALGPSLGQCCGGALVLKLEHVTVADEARLQAILAAEASRRFQSLALFGGGHVGQALVKVLAPLPFHVRWIDSRDEIFPSDVAPQVVCEHSNPVHAAVPDLAPHSRVLIMSFSHAEDLDVVAACLHRQRQKKDLPYIGLIGSATKWASFKRRLAERGFSEEECQQVTCPIGVPGIEGKEPEVIAVAVAAQLLQV